jgi:hypothetical protein
MQMGFPRIWLSPVRFGLVLGVVFGLLNLISTKLFPLADDTPGALLAFYGPMFSLWAITSFVASRTTGQWWAGIKAGVAVAFATFLVYDLLVILRVNLFLNELTGRSDWQGLLVRFRASGFDSLRAYVNYEYVTGTPLKIFAAMVIGAGMGTLGGGVGRLALASPRAEAA